MSESEKSLYGCIAVCSNGSIGLITSHTKINIPMPSDPNYMAWSGIQIKPSEDAFQKRGRKVGDLWASSNPKVLFTPENMKEWVK